jgi:hypothetical protein
MNLTDRPIRLLAGVVFGAATLVPATLLTTTPAGAQPGDQLTTPTTDPCHELGTCPPPPPPDLPPGPGDLTTPTTDPCHELGTCPPPPPPPPPDPDPDPDPETDPEPVDQPVVARPTFTG